MGLSEALKRPHFPRCPLRGFQPSGSYPPATDKRKGLTIDTEINAKRNNMISELMTFRLTKAKVKVKFRVN